jgi:uncharacterized protein (TIGR02453 family)
MAAARALITPKIFRFLRELERHNDRAWFNANKQRYIDEVRDPLLSFIEAFAPRLEKISEFMVADPRPNGGSLFRVYRDTRFSKDKRPYKTWAAMGFRHVAGREVAAPSFYLQLEPGQIFAGGGCWHTSSDALKQIRDAIVADPEGWQQATRRGKGVDPDDDRLVRAPRGYDPEHLLIEDLKRKNFVLSTTFTQKEACSPGFLDAFARSCRRATPLMAFLADAVGLDW